MFAAVDRWLLVLKARVLAENLGVRLLSSDSPERIAESVDGGIAETSPPFQLTGID